MNTASNITDTIERRRGWIKRAITMALERNGRRPTLMAIPLAMAPSAANDFAVDQLSILTAQEVLPSSPEEMKGRGLLVYYFPTFLKEEESQLFLSRLQAHSTSTILLFLLLTEDAPLPEPFLKSAWDTGLFTRGQLYEITTTWQQVTLNCFKLVGPLSLRCWRRKRLLSWSEPSTHTSNCLKTMGEAWRGRASWVRRNT